MKQHLLVWGLALVSWFAAQGALGQSLYHTVEAGQSVYAIARTYGVSPKDLLQLNPQAEAGLHPGDKLRLPAGAQTQGDDCKLTYTVQKKDNLYRIALNHKVSVEELLAANPTVDPDKKLKKGSQLCIPYTAAEKAARKAAREKAEAERKAAERRAYLNTPHPVGHLRVAVVLPFKDGDARASRMLEFYSGMLIAADSVRHEGTKIDIYAFHSGTRREEMDNIIASGKLDNINLIVGPVDEVQAAPLVAFCQQKGIRLVLPFATTGQAGLDYPLSYIVTDDQDDVQQRAAALAHSLFAHANYIFVGATNSDERGRGYVRALMQAVQGASVHNVPFTASDEELAAAFVSGKQNVVVLNSIRETNLTRLITRLDALKETHSGLRVSILGYPDYLAFSATTQSALHRYDTHVYSNFYRDAAARATSRVEAQYRRKFGKPMASSTPRFGLLGFDLGYYFMHGVAAQGESFETIQHQLTYNYLQHRFDFRRASASQGFINRCVVMVHFKANGGVELKEK